MPKQRYCRIHLETRPETISWSIFLSISAVGHGVLAVTPLHLTSSVFVTELKQSR